MHNGILCKPARLALTVFSLALLLACAQGQPARKVSLTSTGSGAPQAASAHGEPLRATVAAMISPRETLDVYGEIIEYVGRKLNRPTKLLLRKTYAEANELVRTAAVDLAFVCTQAYVEGRRDFDMELLVAPRVRGETVYYSYIIVPADSPLKALEELRGKSFAFVDPMSNTGKLVVTYMLAQRGETPDSFFANYVYTYGHSNSIKWVARRLADGASVDSLVWDYANATDPVYTRQTRIIYRSLPYGIPPLVVGPQTSPKLKGSLRDALLGMDEDPEGRRILQKVMIDEFTLIDDGAYDSVRHMLRYLGTW